MPCKTSNRTIRLEADARTNQNTSVTVRAFVASSDRVGSSTACFNNTSLPLIIIMLNGIYISVIAFQYCVCEKCRIPSSYISVSPTDPNIAVSISMSANSEIDISGQEPLRGSHILGMGTAKGRVTH